MAEDETNTEKETKSETGTRSCDDPVKQE